MGPYNKIAITWRSVKLKWHVTSCTDRGSPKGNRVSTLAAMGIRPEFNLNKAIVF